MGTATKFQFDQNFDEQPQVEERDVCAEEAPPQPMFFEADLAAAGAEGFDSGCEAGKKEALNGIENSLAETLAVIGDQLTAMSARHSEAWAACQRHALALSVSITRKIVPELALESALETIQQRIIDALPRLVDEPRVVIRVPDEILDSLRDRIEKLAADAGFEGHCILLAEAGLTGPDCCIEWADGGAEYDSKRLWQEIDIAVEGYLFGGTAQPEPIEKPTEAAPESAPETNQTTLNDSPQETTNG
jgi:flagellar assembly protein FliH